VPFLDDDVLVVQELEFVGGSRTPRTLEKERSIAAGQSGVPMWPRRVGVVRLVCRDDMDDGPPTAAESVDEALYLRDRAHNKGDVPVTLGIFACAPSEAAVGMNEIILHIDDYQRRFADLRPWHRDFHL